MHTPEVTGEGGEKTKPAWQLGDWRVQLVECGGLALDGGSMFGSVPRVLWERMISPDSAHRIPLAMRLMILEHGPTGHRYLVDTGSGDKEGAKFRERFAIQTDPDGSPVDRALSGLGLKRQDISHVLLTHLHFDHGGGVSRLEDGAPVPTFPGAEHYLQRANFQTAENPNARERASYFPDNVTPLSEVRLNLLDGDVEIQPGLSVLRVDGHTDGMQCVRVEGGGEVLYYVSDLAPTHHHVRVPFAMGYDLSPRLLMEEKTRIFKQAVEEGARIVFEHDPGVASARLRIHGDDFAVGDELIFA